MIVRSLTNRTNSVDAQRFGWFYDGEGVEEVFGREKLAQSRSRRIVEEVFGREKLAQSRSRRIVCLCFVVYPAAASPNARCLQHGLLLSLVFYREA